MTDFCHTLELQLSVALHERNQMTGDDRYLIFLCSGAAKAGEKKLSYRVASKLVSMVAGDIGTLQHLSEQHNLGSHLQKRMIFINDCRAGCVNVLTHGFDRDRYLYLDISPYKGQDEFDIERYLTTEVLPKINEKWNQSMQTTIHS